MLLTDRINKKVSVGGVRRGDHCRHKVVGRGAQGVPQYSTEGHIGLPSLASCRDHLVVLLALVPVMV